MEMWMTLDQGQLEKFKKKLEELRSETGHGLKAFVLGATIGEAARKEAVGQDNTPANEILAFEAGLVFETVLGEKVRTYVLEEAKKYLAQQGEPEWLKELVMELLKAFLTKK